MKNTCTVKQCCICTKFGHNESKCFQKSKLDKKSENRTNFSQSCEFSFYCGSNCSKSKELILDSSCMSHIFCDKDFFVELHDVSSKTCVNAINSVSPVKRQGVVKISFFYKRGVSHVLNLSDCLYVPDHSRNLLSVSALGQKGAKVAFDDICELCCSDKVSSSFVQRNGLYVNKTFQFVLQTFLARVKLIVIFGIADWVTTTSAMFTSYQSRFKERNCTNQVSRSLFVTFVLQSNCIVNLPLLRWLCESLRSWNWLIPILGVQ